MAETQFICIPVFLLALATFHGIPSAEGRPVMSASHRVFISTEDYHGAGIKMKAHNSLLVVQKPSVGVMKDVQKGVLFYSRTRDSRSIAEKTNDTEAARGTTPGPGPRMDNKPLGGLENDVQQKALGCSGSINPSVNERSVTSHTDGVKTALGETPASPSPRGTAHKHFVGFKEDVQQKTVGYSSSSPGLSHSLAANIDDAEIEKGTTPGPSPGIGHKVVGGDEKGVHSRYVAGNIDQGQPAGGNK